MDSKTRVSGNKNTVYCKFEIDTPFFKKIEPKNFPLNISRSKTRLKCEFYLIRSK